MTKTERRNKAVTLTRTLLNEHGLGHVTVELSSRAKQKAGSCHYRGGRAWKVQLSDWLVNEAPWEDVENTIRHEVAHAIVGPGHGHGPVWKKAAREIGCTGDRCYSRELEQYTPPAKYAADCDCGPGHHTRHRIKKRGLLRGLYTCGKCSKPLYFKATGK